MQLVKNVEYDSTWCAYHENYILAQQKINL